MCIDTSMWAYSTCSRVHIDKFAFIMREKVDFGDAARRSVYVLRKRVHRGVSFFFANSMDVHFFHNLCILDASRWQPPRSSIQSEPDLGPFFPLEERGEEKRKNPQGVLLPREVKGCAGDAQPACGQVGSIGPTAGEPG